MLLGVTLSLELRLPSVNNLDRLKRVDSIKLLSCKTLTASFVAVKTYDIFRLAKILVRFFPKTKHLCAAERPKFPEEFDPEKSLF